MMYRGFTVTFTTASDGTHGYKITSIWKTIEESFNYPSKQEAKNAAISFIDRYVSRNKK